MLIEWMEPRKITFRASRMLSGYTLKEAAAHAGISANVLGKYEKNAMETPLGVAVKLLQLYNISVDLVDFSENSMNFKHKDKNKDKAV
ncbi:helix-turn-helix domain-containing protein [Paenibacillus tyrfis]|uniref:helix-turn-helix domain-containing protein n=1 Tax=Paenibacillus tyrfis TaxID=1501230 RepID=UPI000B591BEB|nr:helix-turn-helix transcriptional regulator [Paenibacillus tyrfis]